MSGNLLANAGFLDGITDWTPTTGGALSVDETTIGAPGRAVLLCVATGTAGQQVGMVSNTVNAGIAPGVKLEVFGGYVSSTGTWALSVDWMAGSATLSNYVIPITRAPIANARRGLPRTLAYAWAQVVVPAGADGVRVRAVTTLAANGSATTGILKPYLGIATANPYPSTFDPGSHVNPDLQLPVWPPTLRPFQNTATPTPTPNAKSFSTDSGIPIREDLYTGLHYDLKGQIRVSPEELDDLESFYDAQRGQFYVVDPTTDRLCIAEWTADGAPTFQSDQGETFIYQFGLHMAVA